MSVSELTKKQNNDSAMTHKFAGHETFTFRYGWLKKAVDGIRSDPRLFTKDNAIVELGVGKNMVKSIKYWAFATQIVEEAQNGIKLSSLGEKIFLNWDPYLDDPASLWLLHWLLATNPSRAAVWYISINKYPRPDFTKNQLLEFLIDYANRHNIKVNGSTLNRDIDCFIRTYIPTKKDKSHLEETFSCPLNELALLHQLRDGASYQFNIGPKNTLPVQIAGYALLKYISNALSSRKTISISECLFNAGSPGQVFKLDENSLVEYIEELYKLTDGAIELDETAGLKQIYSRNEYVPQELLNQYYT